jgi:hypothetical protein
MDAKGHLESPMRHFDGEMVEIELLLPAWQISALETAAHSRGLTTGQMVRSLIGTFFDASAIAEAEAADRRDYGRA